MKFLIPMVLVTFARCGALHAQSTGELNRIGREMCEEADKKMNAALEKVCAQLQAKDAEKLKAAQQAWSIYRFSTARLYAYIIAQEGTMGQQLRNGKNTELADARGVELRNLLALPKSQTDLTDVTKSDERLNAIYQKLLARLDDKGKAMLREAERAWITYRDAQAAFVMSLNQSRVELNTIFPYATFDELTKTRIAELQESLEWCDK